MKNHILKYVGVVFLLALTFVSCRKDAFEGTETKDSGTTFVKILEGPINPLFFSPFTEVKKVDLFSVRRDANSSGALNSSTAVTLTAAPEIVAKYNTDNSESFEALPESIYTLAANSSIVKTSTGYTFNFASGDAAKKLTILLDGSKYDLSKKYAIAFKVSTTGDVATTASDQKSILVLISIKNKYDGVYSVTGTMSDIASATLSHFSNFMNSPEAASVGAEPPFKMQLRTISATKCAAYDADFFGDGNNAYQMPITSGTTYSRYGNFGIIVEFDPATDKIVAVTNYYGQPASNTRSAQLDVSGTNTWSNGTMSIKYNMLQPSVITTAPFIRTTWDETWQYLGPRK